MLLGSRRQLYCDAIISPYAPADRIATKSPRPKLSGISSSSPKQSDDSQIGPTMSNLVYSSLGLVVRGVMM